MNEVENTPARSNPQMLELFTSFLRMGITAFGGPAMIAYIRKMAVGKKQWLDGELIICPQVSLPGVVFSDMRREELDDPLG